MNQSPSLRQIYKKGKEFYQSQNSLGNIHSLVQMDLSEKEFGDYRLNLALSNIYRDIIKPVDLLDSSVHILDNVVPFVHKNKPNTLAGTALGMRDILYKGMTTHQPQISLGQYTGVYFGKIFVPEISKYIVVQLTSEDIKNGFYTLSKENKQFYDIIDGCMVCTPLIHKKIFLYPFKTLYLLYQFIHFYSQNSHKVILYKNGLSHLFAGADMRKIDALKDHLFSEAKDVLEKNLLVLDAEDRFEIPTLKLDQAEQIMDFVYTELSNMLLVPQSKIRGLAPRGLNATGEYDDINYIKTLAGLRDAYLFPVLDSLKISYNVHSLEATEKLKILQDYAKNYEDIKKTGYDKIYKDLLDQILSPQSY